MANIGSLLKDEITRLSKKAVREFVGPVQSSSAAHRRSIAALKRQVADLERKVALLVKAANRQGASAASPVSSDTKPRFQARGLRSLRARLGLSAEEFGRLIGVTGQSVYNWESEKTTPRLEQVQAIAALRTMGKREVKARIETPAQ